MPTPATVPEFRTRLASERLSDGRAGKHRHRIGKLGYFLSIVLKMPAIDNKVPWSAKAQIEARRDRPIK